MTSTRLVAVTAMALLAGRTPAAEEGTATEKAQSMVLRTDADRLSYGMGVGMARSLARQGTPLDPALVARGIEDGLAGRELLLTEEELRLAVGRYQAALAARKARATKTPAQAKREGEAFLAENAKKEGVVTLPSGLQYKVLRMGAGPRPAPGDRVLCHYRGTFVDGTEFDSSHGRGRPAMFDLAKVIPGWREALQLMPVGSRWQLFIPPELAYGAKGMRGRSRAPGKIGPNATLIYEAELLSIPSRAGAAEEKTAAAGPAPARH